MGLNNKGDELDSVKWEKYAVGKGGFSCSLIRVSTHFFSLVLSVLFSFVYRAGPQAGFLYGDKLAANRDLLSWYFSFSRKLTFWLCYFRKVLVTLAFQPRANSS
jgi:hypothetical protein